MNHRVLLARRLAAICPSLACGLLLSTSTLPAQESVYWGAFTNGNPSSGLGTVTAFEADAAKNVSIVNWFQSWASASNAFPTTGMNNVRNHGSIPLITWEPWNTANGVNQGTYQLIDIINGNHDSYITTWALAAKNWNKPFFLRFMHEMNGNWYPWCPGVNGNTTQQYIDAWKHVHDIFVNNGVTNVTWVWCVNANYNGSTLISSLYPGDNYVDWISLDAYNRGGTSRKPFNTLIDDTYDDLLDVAPGKPVMIAENGTVEDSGLPKPQWFRDGLKYEAKVNYPRLKAYVYFNVNKNGYNNLITSTTASRDAFRESIGLSYYSANSYSTLTLSPIQPLVNDATGTDIMGPFVSIVTPAKDTVPDGQTVEVKANASDRSGIVKVDFYVNGTFKITETIAPYQYWWPVPAGSGIDYQITAKAYDGAGKTTTSNVFVRSQ